MDRAACEESVDRLLGDTVWPSADRGRGRPQLGEARGPPRQVATEPWNERDAQHEECEDASDQRDQVDPLAADEDEGLACAAERVPGEVAGAVADQWQALEGRTDLGSGLPDGHAAALEGVTGLGKAGDRRVDAERHDGPERDPDPGRDVRGDLAPSTA